MRTCFSECCSYYKEIRAFLRPLCNILRNLLFALFGHMWCMWKQTLCYQNTVLVSVFGYITCRSEFENHYKNKSKEPVFSKSRHRPLCYQLVAILRIKRHGVRKLMFQICCIAPLIIYLDNSLPWILFYKIDLFFF